MTNIRQRFAQVVVWSAILSLSYWGQAAAQKEQSGASIPGCFLSDTIYHATINLHSRMIEVAYGPMPLVSVRFMPRRDEDDVASFARKWDHETKSGWQTATTRHVWAGHPQVSDTVIKIVSEIASVDPVRIQRLLPDRFDLELTDGFRLRIMTPAGDSAAKEFGEKWHEFKSRWNPFAHITILEILVAPQDAQTLYYGLEPGTPILVQSSESQKKK